MRPESLTFLRSLLDTPTPSGFEHEGQRLWLKYVSGFATKTWTDSYGNAMASVGPESATMTVGLFGHCDEIGLLVNHVDSNGFVYCRALGGIDSAAIVGKRVQFRSTVPGAGVVVGVVGATAIHLQDKSGDAKVRKLHELFLDIGAKDQAGALARVNIGDAGVFLDGSMMLGDDLLVARAIDNRGGIFVAAEALRLIAAAASTLRVRVVAVSTVQEEVGLHGAAMVAHSLHPSLALVTDVGHATDSPGISHPQHGLFKLGGGPKIAIGPPIHPAVSALLSNAAAAKGIALQRSSTAGRSGTDTDAIFKSVGGIPSGLLSIPLRYMHTTVEMASLRDIEQVADVFAATVASLRGDECFDLVRRPA
ncbi:MAG: M20/M25/M40 family metallo-hydrolase [Planctomycetota bacterium]|nr:M20/M25/M40 family metallo-hydrolase [Planctomycetota bacterium]MDA1105822.1 M20/M25/M40 family metallo-hydrolase [Planctomycetota bacterium]